MLFVAGCAGPAWLVHGDSPTAQKRPAIAEDETASIKNKLSATSDDEPSLAQVLDDLDRIKERDPSDFAVIQSVIEDTSKAFPPPYQEMYKNQMLGVALQQQGQSAQAASAAALQPGRAAETHATAALASPLRPHVEQSLPPISTPAIVAAASQAIDVGLSPVRSNNVPAPPTGVTTQVGDMPPAQPSAAVQPRAATPSISESETPPIVVAEVEAEPGQWNGEIEQALKSVSADLTRPNLDRDEKARLEIIRRLLYVVTNQRDEAVSVIDQLDEDEREYWKHQIHSLLVSIDADGKHPTTRRAALALRNLRTASDHLANVSTLDVRNLTFCKEVLSYGEYRVFDSYSFRAKDEVVLYVEVDNFAVHPRGDSFETELHSSYEIVDDAGRRVANVVLPVDKQVSNNRRRDYFIAYLIKVPSQIAPGSYRLRLTVEDVIGKKSNHAAVDFRIQ
jgi:hypothetical protein